MIRVVPGGPPDSSIRFQIDPEVERRERELAVEPPLSRTNCKRLPGQLYSVCEEKPVHARGFCHSCYKTHAPRRPCKTPGCGRKMHAKGVCGRCYDRATPVGA